MNFLFKAENYSDGHTDQILLIHSPTDGNLGGFHLLAVVNNAAINTCADTYGWFKPLCLGVTCHTSGKAVVTQPGLCASGWNKGGAVHAPELPMGSSTGQASESMSACSYHLSSLPHRYLLTVPPYHITCTKLPLLGPASRALNKDRWCHVGGVVWVIMDGGRDDTMIFRHCTKCDGLWVFKYFVGYVRWDSPGKQNWLMWLYRLRGPTICHLQARDIGKSVVLFQSEDRKWLMSQLNSWAKRKFSSLLLFRPSTDWMRATHTGETICFTQFTNPDANLTQKHLHRHTRGNV